MDYFFCNALQSTIMSIEYVRTMEKNGTTLSIASPLDYSLLTFVEYTPKIIAVGMCEWIFKVLRQLHDLSVDAHKYTVKV